MNQVIDAVDLVVLVADKDLEEAVQALLPRTDDLKLRSFRFEVRRHPNRDGGCRTGAANFLRPFLQRYLRSLVLFDRDGCGSSGSRAAIQHEVDADLSRNGWANRAKAIVIEPELEAWVWGDLVQTSRILGWGEDVAAATRASTCCTSVAVCATGISGSLAARSPPIQKRRCGRRWSVHLRDSAGSAPRGYSERSPAPHPWSIAGTLLSASSRVRSKPGFRRTRPDPGNHRATPDGVNASAPEGCLGLDAGPSC